MNVIKSFAKSFGISKSPFTQEGSLNIIDIGLPKNGHVVAFGPFTDERNHDAFVLDETGTQVFVYLWNSKTSSYSKSSAIATVDAAYEIVNVAPCDFNHDGSLDVLLMARLKSSNSTAGTIRNTLFLGDGKSLRYLNSGIPDTYGQPLLIDYRGNMQVDLLAATKDPSASPEMTLIAAKAGGPDEASTGYTVAKDNVFSKACTPSLPNWNAYLDINGDGRSDVFITCASLSSSLVGGRKGNDVLDDSGKTFPVSFEIWTSSLVGETVLYRLQMTRILPVGATSLTFADIDGDGSMDLVFLACDPMPDCSKSAALHIVYNKQRPFCLGELVGGTGAVTKDAKNCRPISEDLFSSGDTLFDFAINLDSSSSADHTVIGLTGLGVKPLVIDPISGLAIPLSIGDFDLDGYPDIAMTVIPSTSTAAGSPKLVSAQARPLVLHNVPCTKTTCTPEQESSRRRSFAAFSEPGGKTLHDQRHLMQVAFADLLGAGPPGFLLNAYNPTTGLPTILSLDNGLINDAFALRAQTMNGVCPAPCRAASKAASQSKRPYGVNYPGANYRLTYVDPDGNHRVIGGAQQYQTGNRALQSPVVLFGLGRSSSFVDHFDVGINSRKSPWIFQKSQIIPNSDLLISPPHADRPAWYIELHLRPAYEYILWVSVSVVVSILVFAIITLIFKIRERNEDEDEKKRALHSINFDAM